MAKKYLYGSEAREALRAGVETLYKTVSSTFGPCGANVMIETRMGLPKSTKDGVSVARETNVRDTFMNMGLNSLKEVSLKTVDRVGDGTTTAIIFARHLLNSALDSRTFEGMNSGESIPFSTQEVAEMKNIGKRLVDKLEEIKIDVKEDKEILKKVAYTSSNGDEEIVKIIAEGLSKLGKDGNFVMEESKNKETTVFSSEGVYLPVGMTSQYYSNQAGKIECSLDDPAIVLTDIEIRSWEQIKHIFADFFSSEDPKIIGRPFVLIAKDISFIAEAGLVTNIKENGNFFRCCCISLNKMFHGLDEYQINDIYTDLEIVFGGKVISNKNALELGPLSGRNAARVKHMGSAKRIICKMDKTVILPSPDRADIIKEQSAKIRDLMEKTTEDAEAAYQGSRLARLADGVAIISVGGKTSQSTKETKDRVEDAICAVQSARKHGVVPGGCTVFCYLANQLKEEYPSLKSIISNAFVKTVHDLYKSITINYNENLRLPENNSEDLKTWKGYNLKMLDPTKSVEDNQVNLFENGVLDPVNVAIETITNAIEIVGLMMNTNVLISEDNEYEEIQREIALKLASQAVR